MNYFLGVDIGNTKSQAVIIDQTGNAVGFGTAGIGNWEVIGWDGAYKVLSNIVSQALLEANLKSQDIIGAGLGIAGLDWEEDQSGHRELVESLNFGGDYRCVNDAVIGLIGGTSEGWGVSISAGTSNNVYGLDKIGNIGRITGNSTLFGEYGGATEIVRKAIQAISRQWTHVGEKTLLSDVFIQKVRAKNLTDFIAGLARERYEVNPSFAPLVFQVADQGDLVAQYIIRWAGIELARSAKGVIRQLDLQNESFEVVMAGSVFKGGSRIIKPMQESLLEFAPKISFVHLDAPPVVGGIFLGMQQANADFIPLRETVINSVRNRLSWEESK